MRASVRLSVSLCFILVCFILKIFFLLKIRLPLFLPSSFPFAVVEFLFFCFLRPKVFCFSLLFKTINFRFRCLCFSFFFFSTSPFDEFCFTPFPLAVTNLSNYVRSFSVIFVGDSKRFEIDVPGVFKL